MVTLRNIGNRPLLDLPIRIISPGGGEIVEHEVNAPQGAKFRSSLEESSQLLIECDLLNPGEEFSVGLTISDSANSRLDVTARAEYLEVKEASERIDKRELFEVVRPYIPFGRLMRDLYDVYTRRRR